MSWFAILTVASSLTCSGEPLAPPQSGTLAYLGSPTSLLIYSGNGQTGATASTLPSPIVVRVTDANGVPVPGKVVTFAVTAGAGKVITPSSTTDTLGLAQTQWKLGTATGNNAVRASATGLTSVTFNATASAISSLTIVSGNAQTGAKSAPLARQIVVKVANASGVGVSGVKVTFTATTAAGTVTPAAPLTDATGQAKTTWKLGATAGAKSITAKAGSLAAKTITATAVAVTGVAVGSGNGQVTVPGGTLARPIAVKVTSATGLPLNGVPVAFAVTTGGGTLAAPSATTDSFGLASVGWTVGAAPGTNTASATVTGIAPATFSAEASPPDSVLVVSGDAQVGVAGGPLPRPVMVKVIDSLGRALGGARVSFAVSAGGGALPSVPVVTDSLGQATAPWTLGPTPGVNRGTVTILGAQPAALYALGVIASSMTVVSGDSQTAAPGGVLSAPVVLKVLNLLGNPVPGAPVTFAATLGGGSFSPVTAMSDTNGLVFATWRIGSNPGGNAATATVAGLPPVTLTATANAPASLAAAGGNGQVGIANGPLPTPLAVQVKDASGRGLPGATVQFAPNAGSGTVSAPSAVSDSQGIARVSWTLPAGTGTRTVVARLGTLPSISFTATASTPAAVVIFSGDAQVGAPQNPLALPPTVRVTNASGQALGGVRVNFSVVSGAGTLGTASSLTDSLGRAPTTWRLGSSLGAQSIQAQVTGLTAVVFSATAATPTAHAKQSGDNQTGSVGVPLSAPLAVKVTASNGAGVGGVPVAFTVTSGGGAVSLPSALTDTAGIARVTWTLGALPGPQVVSARYGSLPALTFAATGAIQFSVSVTPAADTLAGGAATQLVATVVDGQGQPAQGQKVTWASLTPTLATVDSTGKVMAVAVGTAQITAAVGPLLDTASILVTVPDTTAQVSLGVPDGFFARGRWTQLQPLVSLPGGTYATQSEITIQSMDTAIARVVGDSLYGAGPGHAQLRVSAGVVSRLVDVWIGQLVPYQGILNSVTWSSDSSPYLVSGPVYVYAPAAGSLPYGGTIPVLTIQAGTDVVFGPSGFLRIGFFNGGSLVNPGEVQIQGTAGLPVHLRGASSNPGSWSGLHLDCAVGGPIQFAEISDAQYGLRVDGDCGADPILRDVTLRRNLYGGLLTYSGINFRRGRVEGNTGFGIYTPAGGDSVVVDSVVIANNTGGGISGGFRGANWLQGNGGYALELPFGEIRNLSTQLQITGNASNYVHLASGQVMTDASWSRQPAPYLIDQPVYAYSLIAGTLPYSGSVPVLTVEAGTDVVFGPSGYLHVGFFNGGASVYPGELHVQGTASQPVKLRGVSATPGSWSGLRLDCAPGSHLDHAEISDAVYGVRIDNDCGTDPVFQDVTLRGNAQAGLLAFTGITFRRGRVEGNTGFGMYTPAGGDSVVVDSVVITNNTGGGISGGFRGANWLQGNGGYALELPFSELRNLSTQLQITGNASNYVHLASGQITSDASWARQPAPYFIDAVVYVYAPVSGVIPYTGSIPVLTVQAGTDVVFASPGYLHVGFFNGSAYPGELRVQGTTLLPVRFRGVPATPGSWSGLRLECAPGSHLDHAEISDAVYGVRIDNDCGADPVLQDVTLRGNAQGGLLAQTGIIFRRGRVEGNTGFGMYTPAGGDSVVVDSVVITNNTGGGISGGFRGANWLQGNGGYPLELPFSELRNLSTQLQITGNASNYVHLASGQLMTDASWSRQPAPYLIDNPVYVYAQSGGSLPYSGPVPILTVQAGTDIVFVTPGYLQVGVFFGGAEVHPAELRVQGSATQPVKFRSAAPSPGSWNGLVLECPAGGQFQYAEVNDASMGIRLNNDCGPSVTLRTLQVNNISQYGILASVPWDTVRSTPNNWTFTNIGVANYRLFGIDYGRSLIGSVAVAPNPVTIELTDQAQFTATVADTLGSPVSSSGVQWSTSDPAIATVTASGLVTPVNPGNVGISATFGGKSGGASLTVIPGVASIQLQPVQATATSFGDVLTVRATPLDSHGRAIPNVAVTWSSDAPGVAGFSRAVVDVGEFRANGNGQAQLTATAFGVTASTSVSVSQVVAGAQINPGSVILFPNTSQPLSVSATDARGNPISGLQLSGVQWSSSNPAVAAVNVSGLVSSVALGQASINATVPSGIAIAPVSVQVIQDPGGQYSAQDLLNELTAGLKVLDDNAVALKAGLTDPTFDVVRGQFDDMLTRIGSINQADPARWLALQNFLTQLDATRAAGLPPEGLSYSEAEQLIKDMPTTLCAGTAMLISDRLKPLCDIAKFGSNPLRWALGKLNLLVVEAVLRPTYSFGSYFSSAIQGDDRLRDAFWDPLIPSTFIGSDLINFSAPTTVSLPVLDFLFTTPAPFECGYQVQSASGASSTFCVKLARSGKQLSRAPKLMIYFQNKINPSAFPEDRAVKEVVLSFRKGDQLLYFYRTKESDWPGDGRLILDLSQEEMDLLKDADRLTIGTVSWNSTPFLPFIMSAAEHHEVTKTLTPDLSVWP